MLWLQEVINVQTLCECFCGKTRSLKHIKIAVAIGLVFVGQNHLSICLTRMEWCVWRLISIKMKRLENVFDEVPSTASTLFSFTNANRRVLIQVLTWVEIVLHLVHAKTQKMRKFGGFRPIFISLSQNFARYQKLKNNYLYLAGSFAVTELKSLYPV